MVLPALAGGLSAVWHLDARPFSSVIVFGQAACLGWPLKPDLRCKGIVQAVSADSLVRFFYCREEAAPHPSLPACSVPQPLPCGSGAAAARGPGSAGWDVPGGRVRGRRGVSPEVWGRAGQRRLPREPSLAVLPALLPGLPRSAEVPSKEGISPALERCGPRPREPPRRLRGRAAPHPSPFPAPCLWPGQAAGSAEDESRSLVSPLAAIAVKLEQRPANKAPPPLASLPAARSSAFHSSAHRGICPFTLVICMIKAVLLPFLQPALKRQGSWSGGRAGEPEGSRHPARSPPPRGRAAEGAGAGAGAAPAAPPLGSRRGGGRKALPSPGFRFPVLFSLAALCIPFAPHKEAYSGTEMCPLGFTERERERGGGGGEEGETRRENRR